MTIGGPTGVTHNFHVTHKDDKLEGLPPELLEMARNLILTPEEANSSGLNEQAVNVLKWFKNQEEKKGDFKIMRSEFLNGSSGESGQDTSSCEFEGNTKFYVPAPNKKKNPDDDPDVVNANGEY